MIISHFHKSCESLYRWSNFPRQHLGVFNAQSSRHVRSQGDQVWRDLGPGTSGWAPNALFPKKEKDRKIVRMDQKWTKSPNVFLVGCCVYLILVYSTKYIFVIGSCCLLGWVAKRERILEFWNVSPFQRGWRWNWKKWNYELSTIFRFAFRLPISQSVEKI